MNYLKITLIIIAFISINESKATNINQDEVLSEALIKKCGDFGSVEYFDLDKKQSCLNLLELGIKRDIIEAKEILGKALYNGFNVAKNTDLGQKLIIQSSDKK